MARFRSKHGVWWSTIALAAAAITVRADEATPATSVLLVQLVDKASSRVRHEPAACLAAATGKVTIGRELASILGQFASDLQALRITSSCEPGPSSERRFCRLSFAAADPELEASAGFTFVADLKTGRIDLRSLECFQTP